MTDSAAAQQEPNEFLLPCDVKMGGTVFCKGVKLSTLVNAGSRWNKMLGEYIAAYGAVPQPASLAAARGVEVLADRVRALQAHLDLLMAACQPLLDAEDAMKANAKRMAGLAALARTDHAEALRQKSQFDMQPRVTDVGDCCRNIRMAMRKIKKGRPALAQENAAAAGSTVEGVGL